MSDTSHYIKLLARTKLSEQGRHTQQKPYE